MPYDAIVIGARCAGSPLAMLLARKGYKVLAVDRATFPSDTVSTHMIHPPGIAALKRWGLLDRVIATGCPPIHAYSFDFGPFVITGDPGMPEAPLAYAPRRIVLDKILVDAAVESGVEVREAFIVDELLVENGTVTGIRGHDRGGAAVTERARIVIGADGRNSIVAKTMQPEQYEEKTPFLSAYYSYWSGFPAKGTFEVYIRPHRGFGAFPTNDGLTLIVAGCPFAEFDENRKDIEGNYLKTLNLVPSFAERLRGAKREERFVGAAVPSYFRKPYGAGWALIGDSGHNKDFITAFGIMEAFHQAELCATALDQSLSGSRPFEAAMSDFQSARDQDAMPRFGLTCQFASLEPPPPDLAQLLGAVHGNQDSMDSFARVNSGVTSPADFFAPDNVSRIFAATNHPPPQH